MNFLSLFSGIGGLDLGLERAGMRCVGQVEIDPYCRRVLAKHWPDVPRFEDVRAFTKDCIGETIDLICGGFPCQDISNAGKRAGIDGARSGLWTEFLRIIRDVRPGYVIVENVAALLVRGLDRVLGDLAASGYDAEWDCIPAAAIGAPHIRDRAFILAYPDVSSTARFREHGSPNQSRSKAARLGERSHVSDAILARLEGNECQELALENFRRSNADPAGSGWWSVEPDVGRVAHGVSSRVDRFKGLGNAVVPQVAEWIGRAILSSTRSPHA